MDRVARTTLLLESTKPEVLAEKIDLAIYAESSQERLPIDDDEQASTVDRIPDRLPRDATVNEFLELYLADLRGGASFAGREYELDTLDNWWNTASTPAYVLVIAPPGLGKSSLLVHWWSRLAGAHGAKVDQRVVFCPISLRLGMNREDDYLSRMTEALVSLHGYRPCFDEPPSSTNQRQMLRQMLRIPLADGQRLLFIVDGLDEAADLNLDPGPFPQRLGRGIKILLSMREGVDEASSQGWRQRLGLDRSELALTMNLELLSRGEVTRLVTEAAGCDALARMEIAEELYRLTQGDPLLLRLYLDESQALAAAGSGLSTTTLRTLKPGLDGLFERWWRDQQGIWKPAKPYAEPLTRELLNLFACARGPLVRSDLEALIPADKLPDAFALADALRPLSRWVIGDGVRRGYAFSHPRLTDFFRMHMRQDEQRRIVQQLNSYCEKCAVALIQGEETVSEYVLRNHGAHLEAAKANAPAFAPLVSEPWRRAWLSLSGDLSGFAIDVNRAWAASERSDGEHIQRGERVVSLDLSLRCALYQSSIHTTSLRVPAYLICAAVESGYWTLERACKYVSSSVNAEDRAQAFVELAKLKASKSPSALDEQLLLQGLRAARQIHRRSERAAALADIFVIMPSHLHELREQVLRADLETLANDEDLLYVLMSYLPFLTDAEKHEAADLIQPRLQTILRQEDQLYAAAQTAANLPAELAAQWTSKLLQDVKGISFYYCQLHILLPSLFHEGAQRKAYSSAQRISHPAMKAEALCNLANSPNFPEQLRLCAFREGIAALAEFVEEPERYPEPMRESDEAAMDVLPSGFRDAITGISATTALTISQLRAEKVLYNLSLWCPEQLLSDLVQVAERACVNAPAFHEAAHAALLRIRARLPTPNWNEILTYLADLPSTQRRGALVALAKWLPAELVRKVLALCEEISDGPARAAALTKLATHPLSAAVLDRVIHCLSESQDFLLRLLRECHETARSAVCAAALRAAERLPIGGRRAKALIGLLPFLTDERSTVAKRVSLDLLELAGEMFPEDLARAIGEILPHLEREDSAVPRLVAVALDAVKRDFRSWGGLSHLEQLIPYISSEERAALQERARLAPPEVRAVLLAELVETAPEEGGQRLTIASQALRAIEEIPLQKAIDRLDALRALARGLPKPLYRRARRIAMNLRIPSSRAGDELSLVVTALLALHEHAPPEERMGLLHDALRAVGEHRSQGSCKDLISLIPLLNEGAERNRLVARALQALFELDLLEANQFDAMNRHAVSAAQLKQLGKWLNEAQKNRVLEHLLAHECSGIALGLEEILPLLGPDALSRVRIAMSRLEPLRRHDLWKPFAATQVAALPAIAYGLFCEILRDISNGSRDEVLRRTEALVPLLGALGVPDCADVAARAILDICAAWP